KLAKQTYVLSIIVLLGAIGSIYYSIAAFLTLLIALLGKEWVMYRQRASERQKAALYRPLDRGIIVLAMVPNSPADRSDIEIGEIILKVDDRVVSDSQSFYAALQRSTANCKLDVVSHDGEVRFVHGTYFAEEPHELGILFIEERYVGT